MSDRYRRIKTEHDGELPMAPEDWAAETQPPLGHDPMLYSGITPRLLVLSPDDGCFELTIETTELIIGRMEGCGLHLPLPSISRQHASIVREEGSYVLRDLGSSGGTLINGKTLRPGRRHLLRHLDSIQLSRVILQFRRDARRLRSEGPQAMSFLALPTTVAVRLRRLHIAPNDIFDPGDTLAVGRHSGGFSVFLPPESGLDDCRSVVEVELVYPDRRILNLLAEPLIASPVADGVMLCLKLHRIEKDVYDEVIRGARRDPWLTPRPLDD